MAFINGIDRNQINFIPSSLDELVSFDNEVRVVDAYVESVDLSTVGFKIYTGKKAGQKPYRCSDLLKIILYCYINKIRSSRKIELECRRNIELMWLTGSLTPDHGTISAFIKNNKTSIKCLFKEFIVMIKELNLIDGRIIAIDGTKLRASNAKNKHYNENKIKVKIAYYEQKIEEYLEAISSAEADDSCNEENLKIQNCCEKIVALNYIKNELKSEGKVQVCLTDPDARSMKNNGRFEPCYNVQSSVDEKNKLVIAYDVVNDVNDQGQLSHMVENTSDILNRMDKSKDEKTTFIADTGYYNILQLLNSSNEQREILIKPQVRKAGSSGKGYDRRDFNYDSENDTYICPEGSLLTFRFMATSRGVQYRRYRCNDCKNCSQRDLCTKSKRGREVTRQVQQHLLDEIEKNTLLNNELYKKRGRIVEHPFGTIKRHLGYTHFLRRGLDSVQAEAGLIFLAYDLKRLINIIGVQELVKYFKEYKAFSIRFYKKIKIDYKNCTRLLDKLT